MKPDWQKRMQMMSKQMTSQAEVTEVEVVAEVVPTSICDVQEVIREAPAASLQEEVQKDILEVVQKAVQDVVRIDCQPDELIKVESDPVAKSEHANRSFWGHDFDDVLNRYRIVRKSYRDEVRWQLEETMAVQKSVEKVAPSDMPAPSVVQTQTEKSMGMNSADEVVMEPTRPLTPVTQRTESVSGTPAESTEAAVQGNGNSASNTQMEKEAFFKYRYIVGKMVGEDIFSDEGRVLAKRHQPITEEVIKLVENHGRLMDLIMEMQMPER